MMLQTVMPTTTELDLDKFLERVDLFRMDASRQVNTERRSEMGQFFTPSPVAQLMASMLSGQDEAVHLLDAGAGVGSLSAASVVALCRRSPRPQTLTITAYEIDPILSAYLHVTLKDCAAICEQVGIRFSYEIHEADFIVDTVATLRSIGTFYASSLPTVTAAIINPPYRKINSNSDVRQLLRSIGIETSNLYTAFLWLTFRLLEPGGELVAITPRSFCNGPYFRPFRVAFLEAMTLRRIHVFETRNRTFQDDNVLQENVILHAIKVPPQQSAIVTVTSSESPADVSPKVRTVRHRQVADPADPDAVIHIVPDHLGDQIGEQIRGLDATLDTLGLSVSTGRVVDFRARHLLRKNPCANAEPLVYPGHFEQGFIRWPSERVKKLDAIMLSSEADDLLVPAAYYVLVKRFSAKEEKRRVVAALFDPSRFPTVSRVGFENHLNYFHQNGTGLSLDLAKGLAAFLNSTLVDQYFRQRSGHTQVNAADLRSLRYPPETTLLALGQRIGTAFPEQNELDHIIAEEMNMPTRSRKPDPVRAKNKIDEALTILRTLGLPRAQQNDRSALTLLALLDLKADTSWSASSEPTLGTHGMMQFIKKFYGVQYAENTRETIRRQTLHQFVEVGLVMLNPDNPERPINSPKTCYQIEPSALKLLKTYDTLEWEKHLALYLPSAERLRRLRAKEREMALIPVRLLNGEEIQLTPGGQNKLLYAVLKEFCERYTPSGVVVYVGDAGRKINAEEIAYLQGLGVKVDPHGKTPDVIVHLPDKNWLVLIEVVTSHGPINIKRHHELEALFKGSKAGLVYVTAFETRRAMVRHLSEIAWETEVWIAESPSHIIHFNGERFLGPYEDKPGASPDTLS